MLQLKRTSMRKRHSEKLLYRQPPSYTSMYNELDTIYEPFKLDYLNFTSQPIIMQAGFFQSEAGRKHCNSN